MTTQRASHERVPRAATEAAFLGTLAGGDVERAGQIAASWPRAQLAGVLRDLEPGQVIALYAGLGAGTLAGLLRQLDAADAAVVLMGLTDAQVADVVDELPADEAADVIAAIKAIAPARARPILVEMDRAGDVQALLAFLPDTAGGRMTSDFVAVRPEATAAEAIQAVRDRTKDRGSEFRSYIYVTDASRQLLGVAPLYRLILVDPATTIGDLMAPDPVRVMGTDDQRDVAAAFREHHFLAVPVVDLEGRLIGVITADDVADVLDQEATEDMYRMAGVGVTERATSPMLESARRRVPWLAFNMVWSLGSAVVISFFEPTIEKAAVLAVFIPVITGQAGNAGIQTATIVIRSLALGDVSPKDTLSVLLREWGVGLIKGVIFGTALFVIALVWKGNLALGVIAGTALFLNIAVVASTTGVLLPMTLRRIGIDPATIAGVFDTMFSDLLGNLLYLGIATVLISWLL
jgi:magnesium transporter